MSSDTAVPLAPSGFGRGVIVGAGNAVPAEWAAVSRYVLIDDETVGDPAATVAILHEAWARREPVVIELAADPAGFRQPESVVVEPWTLRPDHELWRDRLHFLVWANNYDARSGTPVWWWSNKAVRLGASPGERSDVVFNGVPAWVDGGPRGTVPHGLGAVIHADHVESERLAVVPPPVAPDADLAADQLAAVITTGAAARIIAPAGSGKTRVLTERLRHLLGFCGYERSNVLAIAYNVRARDELAARTAAFRPRVQTLNGLAYEVLATAFGSAPKVFDEREVRRIIDSLAPVRRQRRTNTDPIAPYVEALSTVRLALRDPVAVELERDDVDGFAEMFPRYREILRERGGVDFDEQIYRAVECLLADGPLRRHMQLRCRHLLVDEFQDLTPAHVLLIRLLAAPGFDVFGVGDDDQVIYGHAGASPEFLIDFGELFPFAEERALGINYRCPPDVVTAAATLLPWNRVRVTKEITAGRSDHDDEAVVIERVAPHTMVATVRSAVDRWLAAGVPAADIAVLSRVNASLLGPAVALAEAAIPLATKLGDDVLNRLGVRAALAYLRLASTTEWERDDLVEIYRRPSRGLPEWIVKWFRAPMSLDRLGAVSGRIDDEKVAMKVESMVTDLTLLTRIVKRGGSAGDVLTAVRLQVGLGDAMEQLDQSKNRAGGAGSSQLDDLLALEQVAALHTDPVTFERWIRELLQRPPQPDGVTLATIHRVKGLEWPKVALFGVTDGLMPHRLAEDIEEERRVFHVGLTRCRDQVVIVADAQSESPFLEQLFAAPPTGFHERRIIRSSGDATRAGGAATAKSSGSSGSPSSGRTATATPKPGSEALLAALKMWRTGVAKSAGVPPYVVFHDSVLVEIANRRPAAERELGLISGIGPAKLAKYAADVLAVVSATP